jgi:hypothetical protein
MKMGTPRNAPMTIKIAVGLLSISRTWEEGRLEVYGSPSILWTWGGKGRLEGVCVRLYVTDSCAIETCETETKYVNWSHWASIFYSDAKH